MGTNFYLESTPCANACEHCRRGDERLHIGKSSAGWCFSLHVGPWDDFTFPVTDLASWEAEWSREGVRIVDEAGNVLTPDEMRRVVVERHGVATEWDKRQWNGYQNEAAFHRHNESERGPNNLLRHRLNHRCVGHGDGPYDLITGEFS